MMENDAERVFVTVKRWKKAAVDAERKTAEAGPAVAGKPDSGVSQGY